MRKLICALMLVAAFVFTPPVSAQEASIKIDAETRLDHAAWLAGRWVGSGMGGEVQEVWSPALGGQMIGHFSYAKDGSPEFYEIMMIDLVEAGVRMRVKHFNPDFTAWEDKAEWIEFEPVSTSPNQLKFNGLVLDHILDGNNEIMTATLRMRQKDGDVEQVVFTFHRAD